MFIVDSRVMENQTGKEWECKCCRDWEAVGEVGGELPEYAREAASTRGWPCLSGRNFLQIQELRESCLVSTKKRSRVAYHGSWSWVGKRDQDDWANWKNKDQAAPSVFFWIQTHSFENETANDGKEARQIVFAWIPLLEFSTGSRSRVDQIQVRPPICATRQSEEAASRTVRNLFWLSFQNRPAWHDGTWQPRLIALT